MRSAEGTKSKIPWHQALLALSVFLGGVTRIFPGATTGFPLNDGGMFYVMIRDLRLNHYLVPALTTYNDTSIPFAYPPLGFYLAALLHDVLGLPEMESLRWLPVIANLVSVLAFYLLASQLLGDRTRGAVASVIYSLTPGSYDWFIMGGGLTRALGSLFLLLSLYFLLRTFQSYAWRDTALTILFCSLTVLSHPEYALHTAASCLLLWIFYGRTRAGTLRAALIGFSTLILTSPWWLTLLAGHGIAPVISVFYSGMYHRNPLTTAFASLFSLNSYLPILLIFRIFGLGWALWKRQWLLLAWIFLPYFIEPRSAPAISFYPIAMLTALGLVDALPYLIGRLKKRQEEVPVPLAEARWFNAVVFFLLLSLFVESALLSFRIINTTLGPAALEALAWIKENTPAEARFLIITGTGDAMVDPLQEWFPALTQRHSRTTLQGLEWTLAEKFPARFAALGRLQMCENATCLEDWSKGSGLDFTHVLIQKATAPESVLDSLAAADYALLYQNPKFLVYAK